MFCCLTQKSAIMIIVGQVPVNIVNNPGFVYFCACVGVKHLPCRATVERHIKEVGELLKREEQLKVEKLLDVKPMEVSGMKFLMTPLNLNMDTQHGPQHGDNARRDLCGGGGGRGGGVRGVAPYGVVREFC